MTRALSHKRGGGRACVGQRWGPLLGGRRKREGVSDRKQLWRRAWRRVCEAAHSTAEVQGGRGARTESCCGVSPVRWAGAAILPSGMRGGPPGPPEDMP